MERSMRVRWLIRTRQISFRASASFAVGLLCVSVNSTAWADAFTDRFQANAREQIQKPYRRTPYPCSAFYSSSGKDGYVVDMTPWAAAAGLRRGDRPVAVGGTPVTGIEDTDNEVWARLPHSEYVDIRVDRAGKEVSVRMPCRDDRQKWEAYVALGHAIAEGRWQDCVDAVSRWSKAAGYAPSGTLHTAVLCMLEKYKVVKGANEVEVSGPEIGKATARLEKFSEATDLAVLRVAEGKTQTYLSLAGQKSISLGEQVFTIGYPVPDMLGSEAKFTDGVISSLSVGGDAGYMQISVPVQPGNSGGALLNGSGDVVGVVIATASALAFLKGTGTLPQNVSWAVKGAFAVPLFDQPAPPPRITDRGAVIRRAQKATCSVTASMGVDQ